MKTEKDAAIDLVILFLRTENEVPTVDFITAIRLNKELYGTDGYFTRIEKVLDEYLKNCSKTGFREAIITEFQINRDMINFHKKDSLV